MRIVRSVAAMQRQAIRWKVDRVPVGFVPTMGYLHAGHVSLMSRARQRVGQRGKVVVSVYVNPTQFGPQDDLSRYPRNFARDRGMCRDAGVDALFVPSDREMYPGRDLGNHSTYVVEEVLSRPMEGGSRPTHFRGVTTVVAKLFNIVLPDIAVFGAKDFQQAAVIRRMVDDLNFPVKIVMGAIHREPDGLAMSSRNQYLSSEDRKQATVLWEAIQTARQIVRASETGIAARRLKTALEKFIQRQPSARVDYVEFFDPKTLQPVSKVVRGVHMALAVFIGKTRLIDNSPL
ncbi:MAG: pantoate--beta-alanine ligase [Verrucomicrobiota bacterium]